MSVSFSSIWNSFLYNQEEDPSEAYVVVPEDVPIIPENDQPIDDLNTTNCPLEEASNTETSTTDEGAIGNLDSSAETAASNLPDDSKIEAISEQSEFPSVATDASPIQTGHTTDDSLNSNDGIRHRFPLSSDDSQKSSACSVENKLDEKLLNQSPDSNGEIPQPSKEDGQSSSNGLYSSEEKLRKKLFLLDTTASIFGLVVPILTIGFGASNMGNCPADNYIPYLVLIIGILSLFTISYPLLQTTRKNFDCWTESDQDVMFMASYILAILWIWKDGLFFSMDASFDLSAENYCNHAFYIFNIFLDIFLALCLIIGYYLFDLNSKIRASSPTPDDDYWMRFD